MPSIYIINPAHDAASYHSAKSYVPGDGPGWALIGDLAIVTVAALVPAGWDIRVVDEIIEPVDLDADVDFVAITGKISQRSRMYWLADEFRRRGRAVLIGGCFASLNAEDARPHADILVTGELEDLAPRLFADLAAGTWADRYEGGRPDLRASPLPRWDLYPLERVSCGAVQTSRGCPFECEFCDVIQYQGRKQRHKDTAQILAELDVQYARGCRRIFLVDDNFTVYRRRAYALLADLATWNAARADDPVKFWTQASIDAARDPELLAACAAAGLTTMFVGIETVNTDSLRETGKRQICCSRSRPRSRPSCGTALASRAASWSASTTMRRISSSICSRPCRSSRFPSSPSVASSPTAARRSMPGSSRKAGCSATSGTAACARRSGPTSAPPA